MPLTYYALEPDDHEPLFDVYYRMLCGSFPASERRTKASARRAFDDPRFSCLMIYVDDNWVGCITLWDMAHWTYVEHFFIFGGCRGRGYGSEALCDIHRMLQRPLVLEVEPPETGTKAQRRIQFYERNGLHLWDTPYTQPPYRPGDEPLPMRLMASPSLKPSEWATRVRMGLYTGPYATV